MKKLIFSFVSILIMSASCTNMFRDEFAYMDKRIDEIDPATQVGKLQKQVDSLGEVQSLVAVSVEELNTNLENLDAREQANIREVKVQLADVEALNVELGVKISELREYVDDENEKLSRAMEESVEITMERLEAFQTTVNTKFSEIDGDISDIKTTLAGIDASWFQNVREGLDDVTVRIGTAEGDITEIKGKITGITTDVTALQGSVETLQGEMTDAKQNIITLQGDVVGLDGRLETAELTLIQQGETIVALQGTVADQGEQITDIINVKLPAIGEQISGLSGQLITLDEKLDGQITRIDAIEVDVEGLDTRVTDAETAINILNSKVGTLESKVKTIEETTIPAITDRLDALEAKDEEIEGKIADHEARIAEIEGHSLDARVSALEGDVEDLTTRVEALESKLGELIYITVDEDEVALYPGESATVTFSAVCNEGTSVFVATTGGLFASVSGLAATETERTYTGTLTIDAVGLPEFDKECFATVYLNTPTSGSAAIAVVKVTLNQTSEDINKYCSGSQQDVSVAVPYAGDFWGETDAAWVTAVSKDGNNLKLSVAANDDDVREATIYVHPGTKSDGRTAVVQTIYLTQYIIGAEMRIVVKADALNGNQVCLPLFGNVNCTVNWADGSAVETITREIAVGEGAVHEYASAGEYTVTINGYVEGLSSVKMPYAGAIRKVISWGRLGLKSLYGAFYGCASLESVPDDTDGAFKSVETVGYAFNDCKALTEVPGNLFKYCTRVDDFDHTFAGSGLTEIPAGLFSTSRATAYTGTFYDCRSLTEIPAELFSSCNYANSFCGTFRKCENLSSIPSALFAGCPNVRLFEETFSFCKSVTAIDAALFSNNTKVTSFADCFCNCSKLETVPVSIFDNNKLVSDFSRTFFVCDKIQGEAPYTVIGGNKVYLWQRKDHLVEFAAPAKYSSCFAFSTFSGHVDPDWK